jgi:hypothetical protein
LLKFSRKAPLKKLRKLSLSLRRGTWRFWIDWNWHQGVCGHWLERKCSRSNWTGNQEDGCLLWEDCEGAEMVFVRHTSVLDFFKTSWKCLRFKLSFLCHLILFYRCFMSRNTYFFIDPNRLSGTNIPVLTLRLRECPSSITASRIPSPVSEPRMSDFGGWLY